MSRRTASHGTFTIERALPHAPARVFAAWADPKARAAWFGAPRDACKEVIRQQEFKLILTEQGAYLDGGIGGHASREHGTQGLVDNLARYLQS